MAFYSNIALQCSEYDGLIVHSEWWDLLQKKIVLEDALGWLEYLEEIRPKDYIDPGFASYIFMAKKDLDYGTAEEIMAKLEQVAIFYESKGSGRIDRRYKK